MKFNKFVNNLSEEDYESLYIACLARLSDSKKKMVIEDDIDATNLNEVMWAACTRSDPETSIDIIKRAWSGRIDPRISPEDKEKGKLCNSRAIIDATRPWEWKDQFPKVSFPSSQMIQRLREKWEHLL